MTPARAALEAYIQHVNDADLDALMALFADSAVVLHPLGRFEGSRAIREFYSASILAHRPRLSGAGWVAEGDRCAVELEAVTGDRTSHAIDHCTVGDAGAIVRMAIGYR